MDAENIGEDVDTSLVEEEDGSKPDDSSSQVTDGDAHVESGTSPDDGGLDGEVTESGIADEDGAEPQQEAQCDQPEGERDHRLQRPGRKPGEGDAAEAELGGDEAARVVGHGCRDAGGEQARHGVGRGLAPRGQEPGDHVDGDVMSLARGRERPEEAQPEHQHPQQGISPGDPGVEAVAQRQELREVARAVYRERNARTADLTDESVDTFYSCTLCQSFAPNHVCVINPERVGLCGAYNWLDCKASHELNPTGPNQPVLKRGLISAENGEWESFNEFVYQHSNSNIERTCFNEPFISD